MTLNQVLKKARPWLPLVGLSLLGWLLSRCDWHSIGALLGGTHPAGIVVALTLLPLNILLRVGRWQRILQLSGCPCTFRETAAAYLAGMFYGAVTPGRLGELWRMDLIRRKGRSRPYALVAAVTDRIEDVTFLLLLAIAGVLLLLPVPVTFRSGGFIAVFVLLLLMAALVLPAIAVPWLGAFWQRVRRRFPAEDTSHDPEESPLAIFGDRRVFFSQLGWTAAGWVAYFAALYALSLAMGFHCAWYALVAASAAGALSTALPITLHGLGPREFFMVLFLRDQQVGMEGAVALSMLFLAVILWNSVFWGGCGVFWQRLQEVRPPRDFAA